MRGCSQMFVVLPSAVAVAFTTVTYANCGLEGCPREPMNGNDGWYVQGGVEVRRTEFDYHGIGGHYVETIARAELDRGRWKVGGAAPVVTLTFLDTETGLENPVFFGQFAVLARPGKELALGVQLEMPWGDSNELLADGHSMLVPYVRADVHTPVVELLATVGSRFTVWEPEDTSEDASAAPPTRSTAFQFHSGRNHGTPTVVDPHEDREFLWRAQATSARPLLGVVPNAFLYGQHVLQGESDADFFLSGGVGLEIALARLLVFETQMDVPLSSAERFERRISGMIRLR